MHLKMRFLILFVTLSCFHFPVVSSQNLNQTENIWAVLIAGSNGWYNYRHQSDVSHAYHLLLKHGVQADRIITLMYDDIANNPQNPYPGKIFNKPDGEDVYAGVKIDYRGGNVNSETFLNVLTGNATGNAGKGTGRVLQSSRKEHVFVYFVGHGDSHVLQLNNDLLTKHDLDSVLNYMFENDLYNKLVFYLEACLGASMFEGMNENRRMYVVTAANGTEPSWATFCNSDKKLPCLADEFSANWMFNTETFNILNETLGMQVDLVVENTIKSHVLTFGDKSLRNDTVSEYQGNAIVLTLTSTLNETLEFQKTVQDESVDPRQISLLMVEREMRELGSSAEHIAERLQKHMIARANLTEFVADIVQSIVTTSSTMIQRILNKKPTATTALSCHNIVIKEFHKQCAPFHRNPYAITVSSVFANLCETVQNSDAILSVIREKCKNGHQFHDVL